VPLSAGALHAQDPPYSVEQLVRLLESRIFAEDRILERVSASCLGFRMEAEAERRLRQAGASDELIEELGGVCVTLPYGVATIRLSPRNLELPVGAVQELRAQPLSEDSTVVAAVPLEWSSSDPAIADVFGNGIVVGKAPGEALVAARTQGGISGTMRLVVVPDTLGLYTSGKSVGTAAALGTVVPGGGELYTGNTVKGAVILGGAAAALAAGFLITSEDTLPAQPALQENCVNASCVLQVQSVSQVETTRSFLVAGAVVAGALWVYGLWDGIRTAKRSRPTYQQSPNPLGASAIEFLPRDGIRAAGNGEVDLTLVRIRP
jgi:hypothetical protein